MQASATSDSAHSASGDDGAGIRGCIVATSAAAHAARATGTSRRRALGRLGTVTP